MNATETVKTALAILAEHQDKLFSERMRLPEQEVRPLSARIAEALRRAAPVLLVLFSAACGWPPPPDTISISPEFSAGERAQIDDALEQWCESVEWCPRIVKRGAEGRIVVDESVEVGRTSVIDGKPVVRLPRAALAKFGGASFWRVAIHEIGHFGAEHTESGIMAPSGALPYRGALCLDDEAVRLWCAAQGCSFTRGTCS